jgi:hypothetical protein
MSVLSILKVVFTKAISFLVYIIILICLNMIMPLVGNLLFREVVVFLNASIMIIFMATLFFLLGSVFSELSFPVNIPAPLLNAVGSLFIVNFILRIFYFISQRIQEKALLVLESSYGLIYLCVFLAVLLSGYLEIMRNIPEGGFARRSRVFDKRRQEEKKPRDSEEDEAAESGDEKTQESGNDETEEEVDVEDKKRDNARKDRPSRRKNVKKRVIR